MGQGGRLAQSEMHSWEEGGGVWVWIKAEAPVLWPPDARNQLIGKDPDGGKD